MCITLLNALAVLDHQDGHPPRPGYTRSRHHIGNVSPGDLWFPDLDGHPHTVTEIDHRNSRIVLIDQFGTAYRYLPGTVINTAVPDPRVRAGSPRPPRGRAA
jgi:hypothetical protein